MSYGASESEALPASRRWRMVVLSVVFLNVAAAVGYARFGYPLLLPALRADLGLSYSQAGGLATASMVGYLLASAASGVLASIFGARLVVIAGTIGIAVGLLGFSAANGFVSALALQLLIGMSSGTSNIPALALLGRWFSRHNPGLAVGLAMGGAGIAMLVNGAVVPAVLSDSTGGWRQAALYMAGVVLAIGALELLALSEPPSKSASTPPDGSLSHQGQLPLWSTPFRSRLVRQLGVLYFWFGVTSALLVTYFVSYLSDTLHLDAARLGSLWALTGLLGVFSGVVWGAIADQVGYRRGLTLAYLVTAACFGLLILSWATPAAYAAAVLIGLSQVSVPVIMAAIFSRTPADDSAAAGLGIVTAVHGLGQVSGPIAGGAVVDIGGSFLPCLVMGGAVALVGAYQSRLLRLPEPPLAYTNGQGDA